MTRKLLLSVSALGLAEVAASARQVESLGEHTGRLLHAAGVDVDFAPVFDVDAETTNPVIGPAARPAVMAAE